jgi:hypothetical protein
MNEVEYADLLNAAPGTRFRCTNQARLHLLIVGPNLGWWIATDSSTEDEMAGRERHNGSRIGWSLSGVFPEREFRDHGTWTQVS